MTPTQDAALRRTVRELRQELQESQTAFAARLHVTLDTIRHWETLRAPKREKLFRLATIAAPIRPDLEQRFLLAIIEAIETDFSIPPSIWQRLSFAAGSRTRYRQISTDGKPVEKRAE